MIFLSFFVIFYTLDTFGNESFLRPLQEIANLDESLIRNNIPSANVSPDIHTLKDHKTQQQVAQKVVENTGKLCC